MLTPKPDSFSRNIVTMIVSSCTSHVVDSVVVTFLGLNQPTGTVGKVMNTVGRFSIRTMVSQASTSSMNTYLDNMGFLEEAFVKEYKATLETAKQKRGSK